MAAPAPPNIPPAPRRGDFVDFCGSIFHVLAVADGVALLRDIKRRRFEVAHLEFCVVVARALSETPDPQPNPNMEMFDRAKTAEAENVRLLAVVKEMWAALRPWLAAGLTLAAYERDCGAPLPDMQELGRIEESRDMPYFRILVGHVRQLYAAALTPTPEPTDER